MNWQKHAEKLLSASGFLFGVCALMQAARDRGEPIRAGLWDNMRQGLTWISEAFEAYESDKSQTEDKQ